MRRITLAVVAAAALSAGVGTAASASTSGTATTASNLPIVTVTHDNGGTQIGTGVPGQPLLSASVDNRGICGGFSYEEGFCVPVSTG
ncbi:MAG: hypothetical protein QOD07_2050 [Frankiaceae bacterium]|jgi:hypothetical protein|nr:hypothetical protein [Frankiaceae bacterium]